MRAVDADELRKHAFTTNQGNGVEIEPIEVVPLAVIDNAQTVESDGRWELEGKRYYCSECGEEAINLESEPDVYGHNYCLTKYCPNCGAKMEHDKNENTFSPWLKERLKDPEFRKVWEKTFGEVIQKDGEENDHN